MNPLEGLAHYLDRLERRLRFFAWTRGAAAVAAAALILTVVIVGVLMMSAFPSYGLILGRFVLFLGIGGAIAAALGDPADAHEPPARGAGGGAAASRIRSASADVYRALTR